MNTPVNKQPASLDQRRAKHAWEAVQEIKATCRSTDADEYAREAKKLPTRIIAAGLGQSLAFILAKAKDKKRNLTTLHAHLTDWVIKQRPMASAAKSDSLMESLVYGDTEFLRRATDETLIYLQWLNRFAEAEGLGGGTD